MGGRRLFHDNANSGGGSKDVPTPSSWLISSLEALKWSTRLLDLLPVDQSMNKAQRQVHNVVFARIDPTPLPDPKIVLISHDAFKLIGVDSECLPPSSISSLFSGNSLLPGMQPYSHCYAGHQFGVFAGQLGDGAAITLGEVEGETEDQSFSLQLKGSGLTPFSRTADGRKILRSSMREFLCSEHLDALGIPTTRAGSLIKSSATVIRDMYYSNDPQEEPCAVVLRIARTFIRFGSFEIFKDTDPYSGARGPSVGRKDILINLINYVISNHFPILVKGDPVATSIISSGAWKLLEFPKDIYISFFKEVVRRTARLAAKWQCVGWCHGVLNTDNMSIIGDTIDYGPFGFQERGSPHLVANGSDTYGRYALSQQPSVCRWNCIKLFEALSPLLSPSEIVSSSNSRTSCLTSPSPLCEDMLRESFDEVYREEYTKIMRRKFGLLFSELPSDSSLIIDYLNMLRDSGADYTTSFRSLSKIPVKFSDSFTASDEALNLFYDTRVRPYLGNVNDLFQAVFPGSKNGSWDANNSNLIRNNLQMLAAKIQIFGNPQLREQFGTIEVTDDIVNMWKDQINVYNHLSPVLSLRIPKEDNDRRLWIEWLRRYRDRINFDFQSTVEAGSKGEQNELSDKSPSVPLFESLEMYFSNRRSTMDLSNPSVVMRNSIGEKAVKAAETDDFEELKEILYILRHPFDDLPEAIAAKYAAPKPGTTPIKVTCCS